MSQTFVRRIENFTCEHCNEEVQGNGYTNHCPKCLWSKHVDVYPGDRAAQCGGMMEPIGVELRSRNYKLRYRCLKCGHTNRKKAEENDSSEALIELRKRTSGDN